MALDLFRRRRKWIIILAAAGFSGYGAYKVYHLPSVARKRKKLFTLFRTLISVAEVVSSSAETASLVSSDLNRFLRSDSDEIPTSLKQISKVARSDEFSCSLSRVSEALTLGILRGLRSAESSESESGTTAAFSDKLLDKILSNAGSGFASVVVGSFARNLVLAFYSKGSEGDFDDRISVISRLESNSTCEPSWIHLISSEKSRELIADCIRVFVSTAVAVYLDRTLGINPYDEFFSGVTNPKHEAKVKDFLVSVCNGAVETLVKTSHHVLTTSNLGSEEDLPQHVRKNFIDEKAKEIGGWVDQVSSTLAIPSNRRLVLDVTGRVTFETVRSFLEFLLLKLYSGARRGVNIVREEVVERGLDVVRYVSAKSVVVATICLTLCMHVFAGMRVLMPA